MTDIEPLACNLPFDGPGVVHVAAEPGGFGGWYQECAVCGEVLQGYAELPAEAMPAPWPTGAWISISPDRPAFAYQESERLNDGDVLCSPTSDDRSAA